MKDLFTVREIMDGTGLSRQRVHQIIKSRGMPVVKIGKRSLVKWQSLIELSDNSTMLNFLRDTLDSEKRALDKAYEDMKEDVKAIQFAKAIEYARILLEGDPGIDSQDSEAWRKWFEAGSFFEKLTAIRNPAEDRVSDFLTKPVNSQNIGYQNEQA